MATADLTREERTDRLAELRAREAARKVVLSGTPLMDLPMERRIAFAIYDPGAIIPRGDNYSEPLRDWQARAIRYVLDEQPTPSEVLRETADMADPETPEVSFFGGDVGRAVAAWLRMLADRRAVA